MTDTHEDPAATLDEELSDHEDDLGDLDDEVRGLVEALREESDASLRRAIRYSGDDIDVLFVRDDVAAQFSEMEDEDRVEALVMKGLGDPPREQELFDYGELEATMRWYENVLVAHFPYREWSGLVFTFDRDEAPLVDLAGEYLADD